MFSKYLRSRLPLIVLFIIFMIVDILYLTFMNIDINIIIYPVIISAFFGVLFLIIDYLKTKRRVHTISSVNDLVQAMDLPSSDDPVENEYQQLIDKLNSVCRKELESYKEASLECTDYNNMWVHQIKNPIASMRLELNEIDSEESRRLKGELNRIEHYVDMVLVYSRLNADTTDLVFEKIRIKDVASSAVKKFKENFISKGLSLDMEVDDTEVLTDRKWIEFILEQYISNALKYTSSGRIRIHNEGAKIFVEDSGIGIRPEDISRIWEKGYTGINGRTVGNSSGLGLYLVKKTADRLKVTSGVLPGPDGGSVFYLDLTKKEDIYD